MSQFISSEITFPSAENCSAAQLRIDCFRGSCLTLTESTPRQALEAGTYMPRRIHLEAVLSAPQARKSSQRKAMTTPLRNGLCKIIVLMICLFSWKCRVRFWKQHGRATAPNEFLES